jgi:hypothetical protein
MILTYSLFQGLKNETKRNETEKTEKIQKRNGTKKTNQGPRNETKKIEKRNETKKINPDFFKFVCADAD